MSVLTALYHTYNTALNNNMVDRTDLLQQETVLLPIYHTSRKSTGSNDMIEVTISEKAKFIKAEWIPKDQIVIFPVTENSIIKAGKVIAPHPLCDELSYLSKEIDPEKHKEYVNVQSDWISYVEDGHDNGLLRIINEYLSHETILEDCISSLFYGMDYEWSKDYSVIMKSGEKTEKTVHMDKAFVTFQVETELSTKENLSVSTDCEIHQNYINYVRDRNSYKPQEKCDISNEMTYCVSRHRGLMGNAKLISISNHNETYFGRFDNGEEIVHIGYEVSQKIHLMLKYLMENDKNRRKIGDSCVLINWFSDDIGNNEQVDLTTTISPYDDLEEEPEESSSPRTLGDKVSSAINDYLTGKGGKVNPEGKFYIMILDKISNGRISIKYFRELPKSDFFERVQDWYHTTNWFFFNNQTKQVTRQTPSLLRYADTIFGLESDRGFVECKNSKLRTKTVERLLPCILDHKKISIDLKNRMLENLRNRNSYDKTWNSVLAVGCSIFKKYLIDYQNKKEVSEMLDTSKQDRNYLYGRLLAVYEKLEQDVLSSKISESEDRNKRATNAERLWTAYTRMPDRTLKILEDKVRPYKERLIKNNYGLARFYDNIITEIMCLIREDENYEKEKNRALNEDFVFGYYAQKQDFYTKKENKKLGQDNNQIEGGNN